MNCLNRYSTLDKLAISEEKLSEAISRIDISALSGTKEERYKRHGSNKSILFLATKYGNTMSAVVESVSEKMFGLSGRQNGDIGHDRTIKINNKTYRIEIKGSVLYGKPEDFKWQHIELKHEWDFLLLFGIDYGNVKTFCLSKKAVPELVKRKKITNQGNKNGKSSQGLWVWYKDIKDDVTQIKTKEDLIKFCKDNC
jgi:hypothetical protein